MNKQFKTVLSSLLCLGTLCLGAAFSAGALAADANAPAAKINGVTITQADVGRAIAAAPAATQGMSPEIVQQAALEGLIIQQLFLKNALQDGLDKDPRVVAAMEEAKRQILARAYAEKQAAGVAKPSQKAIKAYYDANPELFSERRIYRLQELNIVGSPEQIKAAEEKHKGTESFRDYVAWLKEQNIQHNMVASTKAAEVIPSNLLKSIAKLKKGQTLSVINANGLSILQLAEAQEQPVTLEQAAPAIERFLRNQEAGEIIKSLGQKLRKTAKVEYFPPFKAPGE